MNRDCSLEVLGMSFIVYWKEIGIFDDSEHFIKVEVV